MLSLVWKSLLQTSQRDLADARNKWILLQVISSWPLRTPKLLKTAAWKGTSLLPNNNSFNSQTYLNSRFYLTKETNQSESQKQNQPENFCTFLQKKNKEAFRTAILPNRRWEQFTATEISAEGPNSNSLTRARAEKRITKCGWIQWALIAPLETSSPSTVAGSVGVTLKVAPVILP